MTTPIWILLIVAASGLSALMAFLLARRGVPRKAEIEALQAELASAQVSADEVQTNVSEHFERSALLFGKLAKDYREFLEHFSDSAQALGLSETRARELLEQGYQPLLTHTDSDLIAPAASNEAPAASEEEPAASEEEPAPTEPEEPAATDVAEPIVVEVSLDDKDEAPAEPQDEPELNRATNQN